MKKKLFSKSEQYSVRATQISERKLISILLNLKLTEMSEWDACIEFYALNCVRYVHSIGKLQFKTITCDHSNVFAVPFIMYHNNN